MEPRVSEVVSLALPPSLDQVVLGISLTSSNTPFLWPKLKEACSSLNLSQSSTPIAFNLGQLSNSCDSGLGVFVGFCFYPSLDVVLNDCGS